MQKIRFSKFIKDSGSLLTSKLFLLIIEFAIGILVARFLGPEGKGIVTTALVIPGIVLSFADLGLRQATTYFMGKKIFDDQQIISTVTFSIGITSLLGVICALVAYIASSLPIRYGWPVVLIPLGMIPASLAISYTNGILMAKRNITKVSVFNVLPDIIYIVWILCLLFLNKVNVELVLLGNVVANVIAAGYILTVLRKYGNLKPVYIPHILWKMLKKGVIFAIALFVISLNYSIDVIILEKLTDSTQVGIYSVGVSVANMLWLVPNAIQMVNFSYSANASDSMDYAKKTAFLLKIVIWVSLLPLLLLFFLSPYVIPWIYGNGFMTSGIVVQAILPGVWAMLIFKILNSDLAGRGHPEAAMWVYMLAAGINIGLNIWWDPLYGAIGSALASTVSYTVGGGLFGIVYAHISNLSLRELFIPQNTDLQKFIQALKGLKI